MILTIEERNILAHVVVDPDAWIATAMQHKGEPAVREKISNWRGDYLQKKDLPGYLPRAARDAAAKIHEDELMAPIRAAEASKAKAISDDLPSWAQVSTAVDNIANLADAKAYLKKLSRVLYWLARNQAD